MVSDAIKGVGEFTSGIGSMATAIPDWGKTKIDKAFFNSDPSQGINDLNQYHQAMADFQKLNPNPTDDAQKAFEQDLVNKNILDADKLAANKQIADAAAKNVTQEQKDQDTQIQKQVESFKQNAIDSIKDQLQ